MALTDLTIQALAEFSGEDPSLYSDYALQSLSQSSLLFQYGTGVRDWPTDSLDIQLMQNGILAMADALYLAQPYRGAKATPFQSESIGSYSYSKVSNSLLAGLPTGIGFFDMAVSRFKTENALGPVVEWTSTKVFNGDGETVDPATGQKTIFGPSEVNHQDMPFMWNSDAPHDPGSAAGLGSSR